MTKSEARAGKIRWGIIGAGRISNDFVAAMTTLPAEHHRVCGRNEAFALLYLQHGELPPILFLFCIQWGFPNHLISENVTLFQVIAVAARDIHRAAEFAGRFGIAKALASYDELAEDPEIGD